MLLVLQMQSTVGHSSHYLQFVPRIGLVDFDVLEQSSIRSSLRTHLQLCIKRLWHVADVSQLLHEIDDLDKRVHAELPFPSIRACRVPFLQRSRA